MKNNVKVSMLLIGAIMMISHEVMSQTVEQQKNLDNLKQDFSKFLTKNHRDYQNYDPELKYMVSHLYLKTQLNNLSLNNLDSLISKYEEIYNNWSDDDNSSAEKYRELEDEFAKNNLNILDPYESAKFLKNQNNLIDRAQRSIEEFDKRANLLAFKQGLKKINPVHLDDEINQRIAKNEVVQDVRSGKFEQDNPLKDPVYQKEIGKLRENAEKMLEDYHRSILPEDVTEAEVEK